MKPLIVALVALVSLEAHAAQKLLDCNLFDGDTQQAVVKQDGGKLILEELELRGRWRARVLSQAEWASKRIRLYTKPYAEAVLYQSERGWAFQYKSDGYNAYGYADCD